MSILSRALVALLLGAHAFSCLADSAAPLPASDQSPTLYKIQHCGSTSARL